ncbi:MAG: IPT/TIG domain-containing protein [Actinobacteria bacterium]|nr:IPT/TIG domain-containing protein [Actinomycetota bacterium]MBU1943485.1 IPT/TIG domain-containing protein [Actinomycetota bacterium]MBU2686842.1 IPT/TIG domain-containing protein [Actinomycetota bacterium]
MGSARSHAGWRTFILAAAAVVLLVLLTATGALAGESYTWVQQNPIPGRTDVYGIDSVDATHTWAVGPGGTVFFYDGTTLTRQSSGTTYDLCDVAALDASHVWAVGEAGTIVFFNGLTWTQQVSGIVMDLAAVSAADASHVWAVGDRDGFTGATALFFDGFSWTVQSTYEPAGVFDVSAYDANHVWAVHILTYFYDGTAWSIVNDGSTYAPYQVSAADTANLWALDWDGTVLRSNDGGVNWTGEYIGDWPCSITAVDSDHAWVVGWEGTISYYDGTGWVDQSTGTTNDLYDISAPDPANVFAVGVDFILEYDGTLWPASASGTSQDLNGVDSAGTGEVWAVGSSGTIRYSSDGGVSWGMQSSPTTATFYDVFALDSGNAWAVGWNASSSRGEVVYYNGSTWTLSAYLSGYSINGVTATAANSLWVVAENGGTYYWNGSSWAGQGTADRPLNRLFALDATHLWAVGDEGRIIHTEDGSTWYYQTSNTTADLYGISVLSTGSAWASGWNASQSRGEALYYDGSWAVHSTLAGSSLNGVTATGADHMWVVAENGGIWHWDGSSWTGQGTAASALYDVYAADADHAWAVGASGTVHRYTGATWSAVIGGTTSTLNGVSALSRDDVWAVGEGGTIQRTGDGGIIWTAQSSPTTATLNDIDIYSSSFGWAVGWNASTSRGEVLRYDGTTWSSHWTLSGYAFNGVSAAATNRSWSVASNATTGRVYRRTTGTWGLQFTAASPLNDVFALNTSRVWAVGNAGRICRTTNGSSWSYEASGTTGDLRGISMLSASSGWAVGSGGTILRYNGSWSADPQSGVITAADLGRVSAVDESHVWAVGANGTVIFFDGFSWSVQDSGTVVGLSAVDGFDTSNAWAVGEGGNILYADPPFIKYCQPYRGDPGQTLKVQIVGGYTNFTEGVSVIDMGPGITVEPTSVEVRDRTIIVADVTIDPLTAVGPRAVNVITGAEVPFPLQGGFVVGPEPAITAATPFAVPPGWSGEVQVSGSQTGFDLSSQAQFGAGVTVNYLAAVGPESVTANITVDGDAIGPREVNVVTGPETPQPLTGGFVIAPRPVLSGLSPSSGPEGSVVVVDGAGFLAERSNAGVTSEVLFGGVPAGEYLSWSDAAVTCRVPPGVSGRVDVAVNTAGGVSNTKGFDALGPVSSEWYFAEGSTAWGFTTTIAMVNPNQEEVTARVTYYTPSGPVSRPDIAIPAMSRVDLSPGVGYPEDFSTRVECVEGKGIAVERAMFWDGAGGDRSPESPPTAGHSSIGATSLRTRWYFPEGSSAWGFDCWLLLQNPSATEARCDVTYMIEGSGPYTVAKTVPAGSRASFNMADDIGAQDASIRVESDVPLVAERAMYSEGRREGHASIGAQTPATTFYLAEGSTAWGFSTYVLVQNPNPEAAEVTLDHMTGDGPAPPASFTVPAGSRLTVRVGDYLAGHDFSTRVTGTLPIVAERAMYWDPGTGTAFHDSIGTPSPSPSYCLPGGLTATWYGADAETWTCVQNPCDFDVEIRVTYVAHDNSSNTEFTDVLPAGTRRTYPLPHTSEVGSGALVECLTDGGRIIAESSMYWNDRGAGACSIGSPMD